MKKIIHEDVYCDVIYSSRKITNPLKEPYCSAMRGGFVWSIRTQCNYAAIRPQSRRLFSNMKKAFMPNGEKKHKIKLHLGTSTMLQNKAWPGKKMARENRKQKFALWLMGAKELISSLKLVFYWHTTLNNKLRTNQKTTGVPGTCYPSHWLLISFICS